MSKHNDMMLNLSKQSSHFIYLKNEYALTKKKLEDLKGSISLTEGKITEEIREKKLNFFSTKDEMNQITWELFNLATNEKNYTFAISMFYELFLTGHFESRVKFFDTLKELDQSKNNTSTTAMEIEVESCNTPEKNRDKALAYCFGFGETQNLILAYTFFKKAAIENDPFSQFAVGAIHLHTKTYENQTEAVKFLEKAAEQAYPAAAHELGCIFEHKAHKNKAKKRNKTQTTLESKENLQKALSYYHSAAANNSGNIGGYMPSEYALALMYLSRKGITEDPATGKVYDYLNSSAYSGFPPSQFKLGIIYYRCPKRLNPTFKHDDFKLRYWLGQAAMQGYPDAIKKITELADKRKIKYFRGLLDLLKKNYKSFIVNIFSDNVIENEYYDEMHLDNRYYKDFKVMVHIFSDNALKEKHYYKTHLDNPYYFIKNYFFNKGKLGELQEILSCFMVNDEDLEQQKTNLPPNLPLLKLLNFSEKIKHLSNNQKNIILEIIDQILDSLTKKARGFQDFLSGKEFSFLQCLIGDFLLSKAQESLRNQNGNCVTQADRNLQDTADSWIKLSLRNGDKSTLDYMIKRVSFPRHFQVKAKEHLIALYRRDYSALSNNLLKNYREVREFFLENSLNYLISDNTTLIQDTLENLISELRTNSLIISLNSSEKCTPVTVIFCDILLTLEKIAEKNTYSKEPFSSKNAISIENLLSSPFLADLLNNSININELNIDHIFPLANLNIHRLYQSYDGEQKHNGKLDLIIKLWRRSKELNIQFQVSEECRMPLSMMLEKCYFKDEFQSPTLGNFNGSPDKLELLLFLFESNLKITLKNFNILFQKISSLPKHKINLENLFYLLSEKLIQEESLLSDFLYFFKSASSLNNNSDDHCNSDDPNSLKTLKTTLLLNLLNFEVKKELDTRLGKKIADAFFALCYLLKQKEYYPFLTSLLSEHSDDQKIFFANPYGHILHFIPDNDFWDFATAVEELYSKTPISEKKTNLSVDILLFISGNIKHLTKIAQKSNRKLTQYKNFLLLKEKKLISDIEQSVRGRTKSQFHKSLQQSIKHKLNLIEILPTTKSLCFLVIDRLLLVILDSPNQRYVLPLMNLLLKFDTSLIYIKYLYFLWEKSKQFSLDIPPDIRASIASKLIQYHTNQEYKLQPSDITDQQLKILFFIFSRIDVVKDKEATNFIAFIETLCKFTGVAPIKMVKNSSESLDYTCKSKKRPLEKARLFHSNLESNRPHKQLRTKKEQSEKGQSEIISKDNESKNNKHYGSPSCLN